MSTRTNDFNRSTRAYYGDLAGKKPLGREIEIELIRSAQDGDIEDRNRIIEANLKFVFDIARTYTGRGVPISELISEGNMALIKAIDKFDTERGTKFISYAVWWIRNSMRECIEKGTKKRLYEEPESSRTRYHDDDETFDEDVARLPSDVEYDSASDRERDMIDDVADLTAGLDERESLIIDRYYGLSGEEKNLIEIGRELSISGERVRQIKRGAMRKMRTRAMLSERFA